MHVFHDCAWARKHFFKISFPGASLWYFSPFRPISPIRILSFLDFGHFFCFHWLSAKNQDRARKRACHATKFHFLRADTQDNVSKETASLEIVKIGHGFGKKTGFPGVLYLPTEIWGPPIWISLRVLPWPKPPPVKTKILGRNTV